jgi:hypothetical protein
MLEQDVIIDQGQDISGNPSIDFLGVLVMEEVGMVYKDLDWFLSTEEKMPPIG